MDWEVSERIAFQFCQITRHSLAAIMQRRRNEIDVKLLIFAITKTQQFELLLTKRFTGKTFQHLCTAGTSVGQNDSQRQSAADAHSEEHISNAAADNISLTDEKENIQSPFIRLISTCFDPYLDIYTDSVDRNLTEIMERFVQENSNIKSNPATDSSAVLPR